MLDGHRAVHLVVPEARPRDAQSAVRLLHHDAVGDQLEVLIHLGDGVESLHKGESTWSQI